MLLPPSLSISLSLSLSPSNSLKHTHIHSDRSAYKRKCVQNSVIGCKVDKTSQHQMGRQLLPRHKCPRSRQRDRKSGLTNVSVALFISPTYQSHSESRSLSKVCSQVRHFTDSLFALRKESYAKKYSKMF